MAGSHDPTTCLTAGLPTACNKPAYDDSSFESSRRLIGTGFLETFGRSDEAVVRPPHNKIDRTLTKISPTDPGGLVCYPRSMNEERHEDEEISPSAEIPSPTSSINPSDNGTPAPPQAPPFSQDVYQAEPVDTFEPTVAELVPSDEEQDIASEQHRPRRRRRVLPLMLFLATCASAFWVGACQWDPAPHMGDGIHMRRMMIRNWDDGLIYMVCVIGILLAHEMGHFVATLIYRIPASFPFFIPVPITPIGTMGAVIGMDGLRANRRQLFDIGIAGPIAGLVFAIPIMWIGISQLDLSPAKQNPNQVSYDTPIGARMMMYVTPPKNFPKQDRTFWDQAINGQVVVNTKQLNAFYMAGWVGLLITGLNMMPVSQLDGGHVIFTLFGRRGNWIARGFLISAIAFVVAYFDRAYIWTVMIILVTLMGADHPPSANDEMPLGWARTTLGLASLSIPILCFPVFGFIMP